ncbi:MAG: DUF3426 domain-containing protein [Pseudomonadales bacterium]
MNEMISQCPKCMTSFRVTEEQLDVAGGQVRCGYCMNVFMGREYLISGGQSDGLVDEDVLRSLIDPREESSDQQTSPPSTEFSDANALTTKLTQSEEVRQFDGIQSGADLSYSAESEPLSPDKDALSDSLIEPEIQLIEERLKFDEDDLRSSSDEDWALALLAELEDPPASSSQASKDQVASDEWDPLQELMSEPAVEPNDKTSVQATRSGLGFEEIIFDSVPDFDDEPLQQLTNEPLIDAPEASPLVQGDASSEFVQVDPIEMAELPEQAFDPEQRLEQEQGLVEEQTSSPEPNRWDAELALGDEHALLSTEPLPESETLVDHAEEPADVWGSMVEEIETDYSVPADGLKPDPEPRSTSSADEDPSNEYLYEDASSVYASQGSGASEAISLSEMLLHSPANEPTPTAADRRQHTTDFLPQHIDLETQDAELTSEPKPMPWNWVAGVAGMVLLLVLQYTYFYWSDLITSDRTRPILTTICNVVGCELPLYRDLGNIEQQLVVRVHTEIDDALAADIIIKNKSSIGQPFPVLQLTFSDMRNQPVATRKFFPNEYLDGELRGEALMPSGSPIRLSLIVRDPGADATNYELKLLPTL